MKNSKILGDTSHNTQCQSDLCECDANFARRLLSVEDEIRDEFRVGKNFKREEKCNVKAERELTAARPSLLNNNNNEEIQKTKCCGDKLSRVPYNLGSDMNREIKSILSIMSFPCFIVLTFSSGCSSSDT